MINYPEECILTSPLIFDSHAHYDDKKFDGIRDELLISMQKNGVCGAVTCGCDAKSSKKALSISEQYDFVYAAVGIHPENLESKTSIEEIEKLAAHPKCVAIGEIGLDYYWDKDHTKEQQKFFCEQLELANRIKKPVIVHDRDAHADTLAILQKYHPEGVVHCFSGSEETAREILKIGMYIGVGGVVTFKNAKRLPDIVRMIPQDRILIETDCPYLAPEPYRGTLCHSGLIAITADKIAEIRKCSRDEILKITTQNAKKLFGI